MKNTSILLKTIKYAFIAIFIIANSCEPLDIKRQMAVKKREIEGIQLYSAHIKGVIIDLGEGMTDHGVFISESPNAQNGRKVSNGKPTGTGEYTTIVEELKNNTTYYYKAYGSIGEEFAYGDEESFTTLSGEATLSTNEVNNITAVSAISGGEITEDGGGDITIRGVCWATNQNPTVENDTTKNGSGLGQFISELKGLSVNTMYYVRAYATNETGTTYGNEQTFTALSGEAGIVTTAISNITATSAESGGSISDDGGAAITARGICWSTSSNPTISDNKTVDGSSTGSFTSSLTGLNVNTTYYVRAYATNETGTTYGNEQSFKTLKPDITGQTGTLTDIDGNVYNWVGIGTQAWMAENLKVTHYPNGTEIPLITDNTAWADLVDNNNDNAYCYYDNNSNSEYGALYTYASALNACPTGWHLPSDAEWQELVDYIASQGYSGQEGKALKSTSGWYNDGNGADIYGFNGLPGGCRTSSNGSFYSSGYYGYWWSSTENDSSRAYYRFLYYDTSDVHRLTSYKSRGFSVRCLKDD